MHVVKLIFLGFLIVFFVYGCNDEEPISPEAESKTNDKQDRMILIPAGEFEMGDAFDEKALYKRPVHTLYLDAFYIDKYEVTNAQYAQFLNEYGKLTDPVGHTLVHVEWNERCKIIKDGNIYKPKAGYEKHPIVDMSWYGAAAYAQYYGKRLPTEAEWEKAARGRLVGKPYVWGDEWPPPKGSGNLVDEACKKKYPDWYGILGYNDGYAETAPIGIFNPNGYGLHDMAGNVSEWCADEYDSWYYEISPKDNPKGPGISVTFTNDDFTNIYTDRVLRGGSWINYCNVADRSYRNPDDAYDDVGFRCCASRSD